MTNLPDLWARLAAVTVERDRLASLVARMSPVCTALEIYQPRGQAMMVEPVYEAVVNYLTSLTKSS